MLVFLFSISLNFKRCFFSLIELQHPYSSTLVMTNNDGIVVFRMDLHLPMIVLLCPWGECSAVVALLSAHTYVIMSLVRRRIINSIRLPFKYPRRIQCIHNDVLLRKTTVPIREYNACVLSTTGSGIIRTIPRCVILYNRRKRQWTW